MRNLHAFSCPVLECLDASLASQSQLGSTLIPEILKRFQATGVLPNAHDPADAKDPTAYPENFTDGMNSFTERKGGYDDENLSISEGLKRDLDGALASSDVSESGSTSKGESGIGGTPDGADGNRVSEGKEE